MDFISCQESSGLHINVMVVISCIFWKDSFMSYHLIYPLIILLFIQYSWNSKNKFIAIKDRILFFFSTLKEIFQVKFHRIEFNCFISFQKYLIIVNVKSLKCNSAVFFSLFFPKYVYRFITKYFVLVRIKYFVFAPILHIF